MKKTPPAEPKPVPSDLRPEYRFDYSRSQPNRFADRFQAGAVAVVLDPDVASVFHSSEAVNALLRSVIAALPANASPKKLRSRSGARKAAV
jgi:hypothetical protein